MSSDGGRKRSGQQRAGIDLAIVQLETQIDAREQAEKKGAEVLEGRACQRQRALRAAKVEKSRG